MRKAVVLASPAISRLSRLIAAPTSPSVEESLRSLGELALISLALSLSESVLEQRERRDFGSAPPARERGRSLGRAPSGGGEDLLDGFARGGDDDVGLGLRPAEWRDRKS